jgi:hypothetical protein
MCKSSLYRPINALKNPSDVIEAISVTCLGLFQPAGIAPFQLVEFAPLWQAIKNMRLQGIHVSDIVEQHRKAVAIEKGFKEKNLPSNVSVR